MEEKDKEEFSEQGRQPEQLPNVWLRRFSDQSFAEKEESDLKD